MKGWVIMRKITKGNKAILSILLCFALAVPSSMVYAKSTVRLNKKSTTIQVGKTVQLKVNGTKKKVSWSSSNKKIATVTNKGKVKGIKAGKATITAKVEKKKLSCKVVVKTVKYKKNIASIKRYIVKNGDKNSSGDKFIKTTDDITDTDGTYHFQYAIVYEHKTSTLKFVANTQAPTSKFSVMMDLDTTKNLSPDLIHISDDGIAYRAIGKLNMKTYTENTDIHFKTVDSNVSTNIQNMSNVCLRISFNGWNLLLNEKLHMKMKDIGFVNYN